MISRIRRRAAVVLMVLGLALGIPLGVLASHQFADVPDSNIFHDDIDALVTNGITFGCGGGNFCPSNFVTREQMAAFMNRLGSLDGTTAPSVNADQVDGYDANGLTRLGLALGSSGANTLTTTFQTSATLDISAPTAGFAEIEGSAVSANFGGAGCPCLVEARLRHVGTGNISQETYATMGNAPIADYSSLSLSHVFSIAAGNHQFVLETRLYPGLGGAGTVGTFNAAVAGLFGPFGSTGGGTLGTLSVVPAEGNEAVPGQE